MNLKSIFFTLISCILFLNCYSQKLIEIPLKQMNGYGCFNMGLGAISTYSEEDNKPIVNGAPKKWSEIKYGDIESNIYQTVYQNYCQGKLTKEEFESLKKSWSWQPDTLELSKIPIKTKIAFAYGKDPEGVVNLIVDANNNLDFSDDVSFISLVFSPGDKINRDSLASVNTIDISLEKWIGNKIKMVTVPVFIAYVNRANMFMCNFSEYLIAKFKGEEIAVCSDNFTNLSYQNPSIILMDEKSKEGKKVANDQLTAINEYIEIKGKVYKNRGVNTNENVLVLEEIKSPKSKIVSTQIGFKAFSFEGKEFNSDSLISSDNLKGKYVFVDFWAVWCKPCREEFPNIKELYSKTDRSKFEIIGIVGESEPEALKKLIEKDTLSWPQILSDDINKINETFGIQGYPTSFLINPEGIIVAKNLRGKELEEKVLELIGK